MAECELLSVKSEVCNSFGKRSHCTEDKTQNSVFRSEGRKDRLLNRRSQRGVAATKLVLRTGDSRGEVDAMVLVRLPNSDNLTAQ